MIARDEVAVLCSQTVTNTSICNFGSMDDFEQWFQHYPQYRVIICKQCQYAVVPVQMQRHLREHHSRLSVQQRNGMIAKVQSLPDLASTMAEVIYPTPRSDPIPELPVFHDGLRCVGRLPEHRKCRYVCRTVRRIQEHCKQTHQWANNQSRGGNVRMKQTHAAKKLWKVEMQPCLPTFLQVRKLEALFRNRCNPVARK